MARLSLNTVLGTLPVWSTFPIWYRLTIFINVVWEAPQRIICPPPLSYTKPVKIDNPTSCSLYTPATRIRADLGHVRGIHIMLIFLLLSIDPNQVVKVTLSPSASWWTRWSYVHYSPRHLYQWADAIGFPCAEWVLVRFGSMDIELHYSPVCEFRALHIPRN